MSLEIHPLSTGEVNVDTSFLVWQMTPGTMVDQPCSSYLILGAETPIVVDTGFRSAGGPFSQTQEQNFKSQLAGFGLELGDIGQVIHTHLHADHAGRSDLFTEARLVLRRKELQYAAAPHVPHWLYDRTDVAKLVGPLWEQLELVDEDVDAATGIRLVHTGGHSPGHQMVYVELDSGTAVITGDIVYLEDPGLTQQQPSGYFTNVEEVMIALAKIKRDADYVLPMHDHAVFEKYPDGLR